MPEALPPSLALLPWELVVPPGWIGWPDERRALLVQSARQIEVATGGAAVIHDGRYVHYATPDLCAWLSNTASPSLPIRHDLVAAIRNYARLQQPVECLTNAMP